MIIGFDALYEPVSAWGLVVNRSWISSRRVFASRDGFLTIIPSVIAVISLSPVTFCLTASQSHPYINANVNAAPSPTNPPSTFAPRPSHRPPHTRPVRSPRPFVIHPSDLQAPQYPYSQISFLYPSVTVSSIPYLHQYH